MPLQCLAVYHRLSSQKELLCHSMKRLQTIWWYTVCNCFKNSLERDSEYLTQWSATASKYWTVTCSECHVKALFVLQTVLISCFLLVTVCYVTPLILLAWFYSLENEVFFLQLLPHFIFFHLITSEAIIAHMKEMKNIIKFSASLFYFNDFRILSCL